jgi:hypothetical protein
VVFFDDPVSLPFAGAVSASLSFLTFQMEAFGDSFLYDIAKTQKGSERLKQIF